VSLFLRINSKNIFSFISDFEKQENSRLFGSEKLRIIWFFGFVKNWVAVLSDVIVCEV